MSNSDSLFAAHRPPANREASWLERCKRWLDVVQSTLTILALLAGGCWFLLERFLEPQVKLDQTVTQRSVIGKPELTLITIDVRATNIGKVEVKLEPGSVDLLQLNPEQEQPALHLNLKPMTLEPGESDQAIFKTENVPTTVRTIQVHSEYAVPGKRNKYWNVLSAVDLGVDAGREKQASSVH